MALCFTHASAGYLVYEAVRPAGKHRLELLASAIVLANAPDFDFVPGLIVGRPGAFHRGLTHTLAAVLAVAAMGAVVGWWRRPMARGPAWWASFAGAAYGAHLLVDFLTIDAVAPYGARFLWPLSDGFQHAGVTPFSEIVLDASGRMAFVRSLLTPAALAVWMREVVLAVVVIGGVLAARALGRSRVPRFAE